LQLRLQDHPASPRIESDDVVNYTFPRYRFLSDAASRLNSLNGSKDDAKSRDLGSRRWAAVAAAVVAQDEAKAYVTYRRARVTTRRVYRRAYRRSYYHYY